MDWTTIIALIGVLLGGGSITATVVTICLKRKFEKEDKNDEIMAMLKKLQLKSEERDLTDSKEILLILLAHHKKDKKAILDEADRYFIKLGGDSWVFDKVDKWAKAYNVNIDYLRTAHELNIKNNRLTINNKKGGHNA